MPQDNKIVKLTCAPDQKLFEKLCRENTARNNYLMLN